MAKYVTKSFDVTALRYDGENIDEFKDAFGPVATQYLVIKETHVGKGRGMYPAISIESAQASWVVAKGNWLVIYNDSSAPSVLDDRTFNIFFKESE